MNRCGTDKPAPHASSPQLLTCYSGYVWVGVWVIMTVISLHEAHEVLFLYLQDNPRAKLTVRLQAQI